MPSRTVTGLRSGEELSKKMAKPTTGPEVIRGGGQGSSQNDHCGGDSSELTKQDTVLLLESLPIHSGLKDKGGFSIELLTRKIPFQILEKTRKALSTQSFILILLP